MTTNNKIKVFSILCIVLTIVMIILSILFRTNVIKRTDNTEPIVPDRFQIIDEQYVGPETLNTKAYIVYDEETLLQYIIVCKPNAIDIELLYDNEGKPLHYENVVSIYN